MCDVLAKIFFPQLFKTAKIKIVHQGKWIKFYPVIGECQCCYMHTTKHDEIIEKRYTNT